MSETFEKFLVKDDRLGCITPNVKYQVLKGGQNITCQTYNAISQSPFNHVYNVAVPSLETSISREVLWKINSHAGYNDRRQTSWYICVQVRRHRRPRTLPVT
ncbi:MAG: phage major capsid domain-containing protein [Candidatus Fonsibacter sp.]